MIRLSRAPLAGALVAFALLLPCGTYGMPRILAAKGLGPEPTWPSEPTYVLVGMSQDPGTQDVAIMLRDTNNLEFGTKMAAYVADWLYGPTLPWAEAAPEGLLLLVGGGRRTINVEGLEPLRMREASNPPYPPNLHSLGLEGTVTLAGVVRPDGRPDGIHVLDASHPEFAAAAIRTWSQWTYAPARLNDEPIAILTQQSFRFQIDPGAPERRFFGVPERQSDRDFAVEEGSLSFPTLRRFSLPPYPAELYPEPRPDSITVTLRVSETGAVTDVLADQVPEIWRNVMVDSFRTWQFTAAGLGDDIIPILVSIRLDHEEPYPQLIEDALSHRSIPTSVEAGEVLPLLGDLTLDYDHDGPLPTEPFYAEIDLLIAGNGVVAATRVAGTNQESFARYARARAAHSIFGPPVSGGAMTPMWVRQRYESNSAPAP